MGTPRLGGAPDVGVGEGNGFMDVVVGGSPKRSLSVGLKNIVVIYYVSSASKPVGKTQY